ncbi:D-alanyl-D-alanine carboxypeptidase family protein [Blautia glucerasea]|uniref:D-alanyl-D-alanine carboxypeptidase family protein n=1 Tax=Blautia glucerasea TaxID=536633 RepID=UPI001D098E37|nr:serine hydrolase [Blautia glucerasea]MCB6544618.1 serine hydrolase [Blautia glucerasea]
MTDRKRRRTSDRGNRRRSAKVKSRKQRKQNKSRMIFCIAIEMIVVLILVLVVGWNYGMGTQLVEWIEQMRKPVVKELDISGINSPYAVLMQVRGGRVIGEINGEQQMYPASMTKIMTTIVAIENLKDLDQEITLTNEMFAGLYEQDATQAGFQPGETVRAIDLLYGVMLPSGAECCITLADTISGSEADFVTLMNEKAAKLGMSGTNFCDTTGLHDANHYSTAKDIAVLLKYALRNDTFREIIESPYHSTPATNIHPDGITFYSTMFKNLSDTVVTDGQIMGGKTGYTGEAGHCLASFAEIDGTEYILVTGGASGTGIPHINDALTVYNRLGAATQALNEGEIK